MLKVVGASWMKIRMSTWIIGIVLVLGIVVFILGQMGQLEQDGNYSATAYWNQETGFEIKFWGQGLSMKEIPTGAARVYFQPHIDSTGWAVIDIETQSNYPDWVQAYAAGMLEGSLSWQLIHWQWKNTIQNICADQQLFCNYVRTYLEENLTSVKKLYESKEDPFWHQVYLFYMQLEGMKQGFEHGVKRSRQTIEELEIVDFLWLNAVSDIVDLEYKFYDSKPYIAEGLNYSYVRNDVTDFVFLKKLRNFRSVDAHATQNRHLGKVKNDDSDDEEEKRNLIGCGPTSGSSFVKLLTNEGKLFIAHNTAGPYVSMLRMMKSYQFRYHWSATNFWVLENKVTFSSYPGAIHSMDDFYIISKGEQFTRMVIAGTPITVYTKNLWKSVSPLGQVLSGLRTVIASRLAKNASTWTSYLSRFNSGTGNKQWIVVDIEKFQNISRLKEYNETLYQEKLSDAKDIFWLVEQLPGLFEMSDQTKSLKKRTYWAGHGLPFHKNVAEISGTEEMRETFGDVFSNTSSPLAKIFRRDQSNVDSMKSLMKLMRSNAYKRDPFSMGNPRCAIGARGDIPTELSFSFPIGVIDSKGLIVENRPRKKEEWITTSEFGERSGNRSQLEEERHFVAVAGPAHPVYVPRKKKLHTVIATEERGKAKETVTEAKTGTELDEDILKPFNWAESVFAGFPHTGHPDSWDFDPITLRL